MLQYRLFWGGPNTYKVNDQEMSIYRYFPHPEIKTEQSKLIKIDSRPQDGEIISDNIKVKLVFDVKH